MTAPADTAPCHACPEPVDLAAEHVTLTVQVERESAGALMIGESVPVAYLHLGCVPRGPRGELLVPPPLVPNTKENPA